MSILPILQNGPELVTEEYCPASLWSKATHNRQSSAWYKKSKNITFGTTARATMSNAFHCSLIFVLENSLLQSILWRSTTLYRLKNESPHRHSGVKSMNSFSNKKAFLQKSSFLDGILQKCGIVRICHHHFLSLYCKYLHKFI